MQNATGACCFRSAFHNGTDNASAVHKMTISPWLRDVGGMAGYGRSRRNHTQVSLPISTGIQETLLDVSMLSSPFLWLTL